MRFGMRELAFLMLLVGMMVASWFFLLKPSGERREQARDEIRSKRAKLDQLASAQGSIIDLSDEIAKLEEAIDEFNQRLPEQQEIEVILREVWQLAEKHDIKPRSFRTEKIIEAKQYSRLPIKMVIIGDFDGFYSFLLDLEKLPRITQMPMVTIRKLNGEDEGQMQADVELTIFFEGQDDAEEPGASVRRRRT